jgi:hypothetical protein
MFAGSIVALLLAASSLAMACDLSCEFASMNSDCHAEQTEPQDSASGGMKMDGMAMDGMTMPQMSGDYSRNQQMVSAPRRTRPLHAKVVDMGTCERQTCDQASTLAVKANHGTTAKSDAVFIHNGFPRIASLQTVFLDARDCLARLGPVVHAPRSLSLRI